MHYESKPVKHTRYALNRGTRNRDVILTTNEIASLALLSLYNINYELKCNFIVTVMAFSTASDTF